MFLRGAKYGKEFKQQIVARKYQNMGPTRKTTTLLLEKKNSFQKVIELCCELI